MTTSTTQLLSYDRTLGLSVMEGRGFYYPSDIVIGDNGRLYVVNRSLESVDRGVRVTVCDLESEYYGTFGAYGEGEGQFIWLTSGSKNSQGDIYLTDEYLHRVTAFDAEGNYLRVWGTHGSGEGELDGPCGIAVDADDNILISDTYNNRVQKFTEGGVHLKSLGEGILSMPWGLTVAPSGDIYVADWGNDRVARFTPDGEFIGPRSRDLRRAVDGTRRGATRSSRQAVNFLNINREEGEARSRADLERDIDFFDHDDPHEPPNVYVADWEKRARAGV